MTRVLQSAQHVHVVENVQHSFDQLIKVDGRHVATASKHIKTTTVAVCDFECFVWAYRYLYWSHWAGLRVLQGSTYQELLGDRIILMDGSPLPAHSPRPGLKHGILLGVIKAPPDLSAREIFLTVHEEVLRSGNTNLLRL